MLSIGKIALGQHRYYEQQVAAGEDDYYSGRGEAPGEWIGRGAKALGLGGRVRGDQFAALLAGRDPRDLSSRLRSARGTIPRVAALDLTFSAPKSVSVLAAVGDDELTRKLIVAHEQALRGALEYLEDTSVQIRRDAGGERVERAEGLIAAAYRHRMSRALDPQLHTHVVTANLARGRDGRFTALNGTALYRAAKTAGYLYQSQLRALITERLDLTWGPVQKGAAELEAVPRGVLEEFSKRRREMLRDAEEGGISLSSKTAAEKAVIATRDRKHYGIDTHTWREEVRARAAELGLGTRELELLIGGAIEGGRSQFGQDVDEQALSDQLAGPTGLTERANTFHEREVLQAFASACRSGACVDHVRNQAKRLAQRPDVIETYRGEMTTAELLACEHQLLASAIDRRDMLHRVDPALTERLTARSAHSLTAEQTGVIKAVASSTLGVAVIEARAGTGKTYIAGVLRALYEDAGFHVIGVAPTARATRELQEQARIPSRTLDRLLFDIHELDERIPHRGVVILDEAGMAPTRMSARLLEQAHEAGAKVIAIGDPLQLPSIQAGGWLGALARTCGAARLTQVVRQRDVGERAALAALRDGQPERYLEWATGAARIEMLSDATDATRRAVGLWHQALTENGARDVVIVARDNYTRDQLNAAARELWGALGLLGEGCTYGALTVAVGDRVICRHNDARLDVDNGMRGSVRKLDRHRVVIETDDEAVRELPAAYADEHLEHAYALTGHSMQGGTVERAIVLASPRDLTAGWSYTALSRARGETRVLIVDAHDNERSEFAPDGSALSPEPPLARVARRMVERDDEDLALEQVRGRGGEHPERAAERAEPARPDRILKRHEDLDARISTLNSQAERITARLSGLGVPQGRRVGRSESPDDITIVHLQEVLDVVNAEIARATGERDRLAGDLDVDEHRDVDNELRVERLAEVGRNISTGRRVPVVRERSGMDRLSRSAADDGVGRGL
jgi:conjugative relaxase-like TrwC/TraI family protein